MIYSKGVVNRGDRSGSGIRESVRDRALILRIVALALLLYGLGSLTAVRRELRAAQDTVEALRQQREMLVAQQEALNQALADRDSPEELERLARERLGMVRPGERIFTVHQTQAGTDREEQVWNWKSEAS